MDIGERCTHCGDDVSFGSGKFINRIPSVASAESASEWLVGWRTHIMLDGYMCAECQCLDCETCGKPVWIDEEVDDADGFHHHAVCLPQHKHAGIDGEPCQCQICALANVGEMN